MPVSAVRLNHAVLFVADLERSLDFYRAAVANGGRGARASRRRRLPAAACVGSHHDPGLFGIGAPPPWPRGYDISFLPPGLAGRHDRGPRGGAHHPGRAGRPDGRVEPRRDQERVRRRPRRQRVRGDVDAAEGAGALYEDAAPVERLDLPGEVRRGAASAPPASWCRATPSRRRSDPPRPPGEGSAHRCGLYTKRRRRTAPPDRARRAPTCKGDDMSQSETEGPGRRRCRGHPGRPGRRRRRWGRGPATVGRGHPGRPGTGGADGGAEGPADGGAEGTPGVQDGGADGGADSSA